MSYNRQQLEEIIRQKARDFGVNPDIAVSVARVESGFNPKAVSSAGAQGVFQLMPDTARGLGVSNPFDPMQNITGGVKYLSQQLKRFGDYDKALAAYNAGPGNVERYGGIPPFKETQNYVKKVKSGISLQPQTEQAAEQQQAGLKIDPQKLLAAFTGELLKTQPSLTADLFGLMGRLPGPQQGLYDASRLTPQSSYLQQLTRPLIGL